METLLATLSVKRIFFLGDLFHSDRNKEWERFSEWNQQNSFPSILVKGNHDILPDFLLEQSGLRVEEEWFEAGLCLTHHPQQKVTTSICVGMFIQEFGCKAKATTPKSTLFFIAPTN